MRIQNQNIASLQKAYNQTKKMSSSEDIKRAGSKDGLEISSDGRIFGKALQALRQLEEKPKDLDGIKEAVQKGTYQVKNEEVAEKMWQDTIFDAKI